MATARKPSVRTILPANETAAIILYYAMQRSLYESSSGSDAESEGSQQLPTSSHPRPDRNRDSKFHGTPAHSLGPRRASGGVLAVSAAGSHRKVFATRERSSFIEPIAVKIAISKGRVNFAVHSAIQNHHGLCRGPAHRSRADRSPHSGSDKPPLAHRQTTHGDVDE